MASANFKYISTGVKVHPAIVKKLSIALAEAVQSPDVAERLMADGSTPFSSTPEAFRAHIHSEIAKWRNLVKDAGLQLK
jgi:tripartite-type tricarboxylate transporter receptor subunit TctC